MSDDSQLLASSIQNYLAGRVDLARQELEEALRCNPANERARSFMVLLQSLARSSAAFEETPQIPRSSALFEETPQIPLPTAEAKSPVRPPKLWDWTGEPVTEPPLPGQLPDPGLLGLKSHLRPAAVAREVWFSISDWAAGWDFRAWGDRALQWASRYAPQLILAVALLFGGWTALRNRAVIAHGAGLVTSRLWPQFPRAGPEPLTPPPLSSSNISTSEPIPPVPASVHDGQAPRVLSDASTLARSAPRRVAPAIPLRTSTALSGKPVGVPSLLSPESASPDVIEPMKSWAPPPWGLEVDEVVRSSPPGVVHVGLHPFQSEGGLIVRASAENVPILSGKYSARFLFDSAGELSAVQLRCSQQRRSTESVFDELLNWLSAAYGPAREEGGLPGEGPTMRRLTWNAANTRVRLEVMRSGDVGRAHILLLDVNSGSVRPADTNSVVATFERTP